MTDLYNGQITDLLNNAHRYDPEVIAFSYAILQEKRRIMQELAQTRTMSVIDDLPESILDVGRGTPHTLLRRQSERRCQAGNHQKEFPVGSESRNRVSGRGIGSDGLRRKWRGR